MGSENSIKRVLFISAIVLLPFGGRSSDYPSTVPDLDLSRYMGLWHQIAHLPNRFQSLCAGDTTARYRLSNRGNVEVVNQCFDSEGVIHRATGVARRHQKHDDPARLEIRFAPAIFSFLPFVWGDYWVLHVEPDYDVALVGSPNRRYLWVLARDQTVSERTYKKILKIATEEGFPVSRLVR